MSRTEIEQRESRDHHWLAKWLGKWEDRDGGQIPTSFNHVYPAIARATSLAEAVFLDFFLYMWLTKKHEDGPRVYERRPGWGIYIYPAWFSLKTGLTVYQFRSIAKRYEEEGIFKTRVDKRYGNRKYYSLNFNRLNKYLLKCLTPVWSEVRADDPLEE